MVIANSAYIEAVRAIEGAKYEIVNFWRFNEKSDIWTFKPHAHDFYELLFFLHGNAQISLRDRSLYATYSDALLYPPGAVHTEHLQINHRQEIYCLQVRAQGIEVGHVLHIQDRRHQIRLTLDGLFAEYEGGDRNPNVMDGYLRTLFQLIARDHFFGDQPAHPIDYCMMYMRHNLAEEITIQQLADLIHVSRSYLNKIFVERAGMTPMQYMQSIRIDAAKSLLMTTRQSIGDIASEVGFNSPKYFCHIFHRATGMSPREFRNAEGLDAFARQSLLTADEPHVV